MATTAASSLVTAMTLDLWQAVRSRVGKLLGRGDSRAEQVVLDTLDEDVTAYAQNRDIANDLRAQWATRLRDLLRIDPSAAQALRELVAEVNAARVVSASGHGVAAGRDVHVEASHGGIVANHIQGSVSTTIQGSVFTPNPPLPGADQA